MTLSGIIELSVLEAEFTRAGGTDFLYLRDHYARFVATKREYDRDHQQAPGALLDVGAHWLHQAMLWALNGWRVVAMDLPATFELSMVRDLAGRHAIRLLPNDNFDRTDALAVLDDNSIDVVLFTEIIEHATFNPVALWRAIHRVLRPGGTIVVTTPNYYALRGRAWAPLRFFSGGGGGLTVASLINEPTLAHHWKEYSRKELEDYFTRLSADFRIAKNLRTCDYHAQGFTSPFGRILMAVERALPFLRPNLYLEVRVEDKRHGVIGDPSWS